MVSQACQNCSESDEQSYLFSLVSLLFCHEDNKDGGTVVSSVCTGVLQGKHGFMAEDMSWRYFPPPSTQLIPCNFEEWKKRIPYCKTTGETWI